MTGLEVKYTKISCDTPTTWQYASTGCVRRCEDKCRPVRRNDVGFNVPMLNKQEEADWCSGVWCTRLG